MSRETQSLRKSLTFGLLPQIAYRIKIDEGSKSRISKISNVLIERPELSYAIYANHISYNDPLFEAFISTRLDRHQTRHLIAPASYSHTDPIKPRSKSFITMIEGAKRCGVEIIRVIQPYQIDNPEFGYTKELANKTHKEWLKRLQTLGRSNIPTGVLISPEGHRSDTGTLGEGESGVVACGRLLFPLIYVPIGISYDRGYDRNGINLGKRVSLTIGNTYVQETAKDFPNLNLLMRNLALTLPLEMRGEW